MPRSPSSTQATSSARLDLGDRDAARASTSRPRIIGTRSIWALGGLALSGSPRRHRPAAFGMSRKKKLGACSGRRLRRAGASGCVSMSASVTSSVMPRPERQHQRGRQRARAVDVGERQPRRRPPRARQAAGERHDAERHEAQEHEGPAAARRRTSARCAGRRPRAAASADQRRDRERRAPRDSACAASAAPGSIWSRNRPETGTSWARPSGASAKTRAVSRP